MTLGKVHCHEIDLMSLKERGEGGREAPLPLSLSFPLGAVEVKADCTLRTQPRVPGPGVCREMAGSGPTAPALALPPMACVTKGHSKWK